MFDALFIVSIFSGAVQAIKEVFEPVVPAENWANEELYNKDLIDGVPAEQRMRNVRDGKYKMDNNHPKPHRDQANGKIVIENCDLYYKDIMNHGAYQAQQWARQGRYNLEPDELQKERERIEARYKRMYSLV